jgi:hypothetical protein
MATLFATLALASAVSVASARNFSVSNQNFRIVYTPLQSETGGGTPINCSVTLEGSFHYRTNAKTIGALTGYITRAQVHRPCSGFGEAWIYNGTEGGLTNNVNSLPWHTTFEGFTGTLPSISTMRLLLSGFRYLVQASFGICLSIYGPNRTQNAIASLNASGVITGVSPDSQLIAEESGICGSLNYSGNGTVTVLGTSTSITVRLI